MPEPYVRKVFSNTERERNEKKMYVPSSKVRHRDPSESDVVTGDDRSTRVSKSIMFVRKAKVPTLVPPVDAVMAELQSNEMKNPGVTMTIAKEECFDDELSDSNTQVRMLKPSVNESKTEYVSEVENKCDHRVTKAIPEKENKKEIKNDVAGPGRDDIAAQEHVLADQATGRKSVVNRTVVRYETAICTFKGVDTRVKEDSGGNEDTDVTSSPILNKKGDGEDSDDNSYELQVQTKGDVNEYPTFDKKEYEIKEWKNELSFYPEGTMTSIGGIKYKEDENAPTIRKMSEEKNKEDSNDVKCDALEHTSLSARVIETNGVKNAPGRGASERLVIKIGMLHRVRLISQLQALVQNDHNVFQKWNGGNATLILLNRMTVMRATEVFRFGYCKIVFCKGNGMHGFKGTPWHRVAIPRHKLVTDISRKWTEKSAGKRSVDFETSKYSTAEKLAQ